MVMDSANSDAASFAGAVLVFRKGPSGYEYFQTIYPTPALAGAPPVEVSLSLKGNVATFVHKRQWHFNPLYLIQDRQAYVFEFNGTQWEIAALLDPVSSPQGLDLSRNWGLYGAVVIDDEHLAFSAWGTVDGTNPPTMLLQAGQVGVPAVHFYHKVGGAWLPDQIVWGGTVVGPRYLPIAMAADGGRVVAASPYDMSFAVYERNGQGDWYVSDWVENPFRRDWENDPYASIAIQGDLIVFGQPYDITEMFGFVQPHVGTVQVFRETSLGWQLEADLEASDSWWGPSGLLDWKCDRFGYSVDVDQGRIVVGAVEAHIDPSLQGPLDGFGAAYVFEHEGGQWTEKYRLWAEDPAAGEGFGKAVSLEGDTVVVTNEFYTTSGNQLTAQVFHLPMGAEVCPGHPNSGGGAGHIAVSGFEDPSIGFLKLAASD
ncbi:MAG: hypothetical protein KDB61_06895, partial [Planctomycetes bacterium]|nr:hypothetical protein [Planctomycetota bacterium]